ncbi:unnamed protein product [Lepidochelys kempii]
MLFPDPSSPPTVAPVSQSLPRAPPTWGQGAQTLIGHSDPFSLLHVGLPGKGVERMGRGHIRALQTSLHPAAGTILAPLGTSLLPIEHVGIPGTSLAPYMLQLMVWGMLLRLLPRAPPLLPSRLQPSPTLRSPRGAAQKLSSAGCRSLLAVPANTKVLPPLPPTHTHPISAQDTIMAAKKSGGRMQP